MNKRQVDLLKFLCTTSNYTTAKSLSEKFKTSTKTIYSDLNVLLNNLKNTDIELIRKPRVGIKLQASTTARTNLLHTLVNLPLSETNQSDAYSPSKRRSYLVKTIILNNQPQSLKSLAEKWLISKTSILNDLDSINLAIISTNGQIKSDGSVLHFVGNEEQRQVATSTYIATNSGRNATAKAELLQEFFSSDLLDTVSEVFNILGRLWFAGLPSYYQFAIRLVTLVQIHRLLDGIHFKYAEVPSNRWQDTDAYKVAEQLMSLVASRLSLSYGTDDVERLSRNLSAYRLGDSIQPENAPWDEDVEALIDRIESIQKISFLSRSQLKKQLLYHIPAMVLRLQQGMIVRNPLLNDIKSQYSALFGMTWYALSFLEEKYNIALNDDEVSFITIYFHISLNKVMPRNTVMIVYGQHSQLRDYVESQIQQLLPVNTKFRSVSAHNLDTKTVADVDLIIAVDVSVVVGNVPVVMITPLMDAKDQSSILIGYAKNVLMRQQIKSSHHFPVLRNTVSENLIFWKDSVSDKDAALDLLVSKLEQVGAVHDDFRDSIYRREKLGSTEIEGGSALPHAAPKTVKKTAVAILILNKPVWWNTLEVNVVILACVPNNHIQIYQQLILDIYQLVKNKQMVQMITHLNSSKALLQMIKR
jgi:activator of the mannose operon (transcriptional antiterminator)